MRSTKVIVFFIFGLCGCIGVDYIDDPIVGASIEITHSGSLALLPDETLQLQATYFNEYGLEEQVSLTWTTSNADVATVSQSGLVTAVGKGQANILAAFGAADALVTVNVVLGPDDVATVQLDLTPFAIDVDQQVDISDKVIVKNIDGDLLDGRVVEWFSENASIATINASGVVTGVAAGVTDLHAKVEGVKSNVVPLTVGSARAATFVSAGGYNTSGMATLEQQGEDVILKLSDNFMTSFALGTFVYLANSTNGATVRSNGLELAQITTNGAKTFNVSDVNPDVELYDYRYVIILCKPAQVTFGIGDFN